VLARRLADEREAKVELVQRAAKSGERHLSARWTRGAAAARHNAERCVELRVHPRPCAYGRSAVVAHGDRHAALASVRRATGGDSALSATRARACASSSRHIAGAERSTVRMLCVRREFAPSFLQQL
jgi:hypothetical protein